MESEGKKGQDTSMSSESEGYIADDETRPGPTVMQRLKERVSDYENHLKGKESSDKEDPHPELSYIPPADGKEAAVTEGKQHGGSPVAALGKNVSEGAKTHPSDEGVDKPTTVEKIKEKFWETENHMKGKEPSATEDPHPELAYITPMSQEQKPGFFSRMGQKFGGQEHEKKDATAPTKASEVQAANKGVGSSELGTGYEEDGEETTDSAVVPKSDEGVKPPSEMQGGSEVGTGYEEGSEGSFSDMSDLGTGRGSKNRYHQQN